MSDQLAALIAKHVNEEEVVGYCRDLVQARGENPPGDESQVAKVAEKHLNDLGLDVEFVEPLPNRVSTLGTWASGSDGKVLLFNGHYDVVPATDADAWPHDPFEGAIADGKLYGRGTTDMKSGIASCLAAIATMKRAGLKPKGKLLVHLVADEEALGEHGTGHLVRNGYCDGIDAAVVGEPTSLNLVTSERGALWLRIVTKGISAHGSTPQLGVNAIGHMAHVIQAVSGMRFRKLHEQLGAPTVNIGTVHGGAKINSVADECTIEIDRRSLPGETKEEMLAEFQAAIDVAAEQVPEMRAEIIVDGWAGPSETPQPTPIVDLLSEARSTFGGVAHELGYGGATDARYLINYCDIPAVVFGPGDILLAHTTGEYVNIAEMVEATKIYALTFARFLEAT